MNEVGKAIAGIAADIGLAPAEKKADDTEEDKTVEESNIDELMDDAAALIKETDGKSQKSAKKGMFSSFFAKKDGKKEAKLAVKEAAARERAEKLKGSLKSGSTRALQVSLFIGPGP